MQITQFGDKAESEHTESQSEVCAILIDIRNYFVPLEKVVKTYTVYN